jgi:hypothetical protein
MLAITKPNPPGSSLSILDKLPREVRQYIYELAFDVEAPIQVKHCREFDLEATIPLLPQLFRRSALLSVSRGVNQEVFWVLFSKGTMLILINDVPTQRPESLKYYES